MISGQTLVAREDLRPLGERLAAEYPSALVVSLRAPNPSDFGFGYQWISPTGLDDVSRVERVAEAMPGFAAAVRQWQAEAGLGPEATVLVGFSQGAMMVLEAASHAGESALAGRVVARGANETSVRARIGCTHQQHPVSVQQPVSIFCP